MLKGIPPNLSPELFKIMLEMGHGDDLVLADGNFPAASMAKRLVRADGHDIPSLLASILSFYPLDTFVDRPVLLMQTVDQDQDAPPIWTSYSEIIAQHSVHKVGIDYLERFQFYEQAKQAYAIVATSESSLYANIILKKGIIENE